MTGLQVLTVAIALIVPMSLVFYSSRKVKEAEETLRAEMKLAFAQVMHAIENLKVRL